MAPLSADPSDPVEQVPAGVKGDYGSLPIRLVGDQMLVTKDTFRPPIEITIVAQTDSTNLRISYTAKDVIFNWERNPSQLRVDGGPADGEHRKGKGAIPVGKYVTIRWDVTPTQESIYVDGELRFQNTADYSKIDNPIGVFGHDSIVKVMSLTTRTLPTSSPAIDELGAAPAAAVEQVPGGLKGDHGNPPLRVEENEVLVTKENFRPPIEINIVAQTDSTDLRIAYTADQVIFNWAVDESELRVDGGPAGGKHKVNEGLIPVGKYVTIKWDVTPTQESIYVDGDLRFQNTADYSKIDRPISVFGYKSIIKVMSLTTQQP
jgi:hypothetical protein